MLKITEEEFDEAYLFPLQQLVVYNPEIYPEVEHTGLHVFATEASPRYPSIRFAYTYNDTSIYLWYAELKDPDGE